jgi:hypothetical protein
MRLELEQIPEDEKRAFIEAQMKCGTDEFSDARLERFLRCEGMNAKVCVEACAKLQYHVCRQISSLVGNVAVTFSWERSAL